MSTIVSPIAVALIAAQAASAHGTAALSFDVASIEPAAPCHARGQWRESKAGETIHVTPKEFDLLHYLMSHAGLPIMHARLLRAVWGPEYGGELEYLRTFIRQLRKKLEDDPAEPAYLLTDSHVGYRFAEAKPEPAEGKA
jgi:DNA-binding response OmpR family regulator